MQHRRQHLPQVAGGVGALHGELPEQDEPWANGAKVHRRPDLGTGSPWPTGIISVEGQAARHKGDNEAREPPHRMRLAHRSFVRGYGEWTLRAPVAGDPRRTLFTWTEDLAIDVPVIGQLALAAYRPVMGRLMLGSLRNLQRLLARSRT